MTTLLADLRSGLRALARSPWFTLVAALSLALGIGSTTTIFSLINAVLVRPLPAGDPGGLARLYALRDDGSRSQRFSYSDYLDLGSGIQPLEAIGAQLISPMTLGADGIEEPILAEIVSGSYFSVLQAPPALGRALEPADDASAAEPAVVISHTLWTRRFGARPDVLGRAVRLNGTAFTIVGVVRPGFTGTFAGAFTDAWVALEQTGMWRAADWRTNRDLPLVQIIGRLRPGTTRAQAQAAASLRAAQIRASWSDKRGLAGVELGPATLLHGGLRRGATALLSILMALVSLVLLVACANVSSMMVTRAVGRAREVAIRLALGATRGRIVRQLLTESLLVAAAGGLAGLVLAVWSAGLLGRLNPIPSIPLQFDLSPDPTVALYCAGATLLAGLVMGLAPALQASRPDVAPALAAESSTATMGRSARRLRDLFVAAQVAISLVLLIGAGLLVRSLGHAQELPLGFEPDRGIALDVDLGAPGLTSAVGLRLHEAILDRVRSVPGVRAASLADLAPLDIATARFPIQMENAAAEERRDISGNVIAPGYFATLGIELTSGRDFEPSDDASRDGVVIVNETLARAQWPGADPLGRRLNLLPSQGAPARRAVVVGVARDVKYRTLGEQPEPHIYLPLAQSYSPSMTLLVSAQGAPEPLVAAVPQLLRREWPGVGAFFPRTLRQHMGFSLLPARLGALLAGVAGALALLLSVVGIYAVMSHSVAQRAREVAVRMALGATRGQITSLILGRGLRVTAAGLAAGLILALGLGRLLASQLYGIRPTDAVTFAGVTLLLLAVAAVAAWLPARRAATASPSLVLRSL